MMCQTLGIRQAAQTEILMAGIICRTASTASCARRSVCAAQWTSCCCAALRQSTAGEPGTGAAVCAGAGAGGGADEPERQKLRPCRRAYEQRLRRFVLHAATDDPNQRKSMRYIGSCIGRIFYLLDKAERFEADRRNGQYNVFVVNELNGQLPP